MVDEWDGVGVKVVLRGVDHPLAVPFGQVQDIVPVLTLKAKDKVKPFDSLFAGGEDADAGFNTFEHTVVDVLGGLDANRSVNTFDVEHKLSRLTAKQVVVHL